MFNQLEKKIIAKINAIESKSITPNESGIGKLLSMMKNIDEPCYDTLFNRYKNALDRIG